jgi:ATP-dependent exoDNAse (exonuclease V) alpha subunit
VQKAAREAVTFARERSFEREAVTDERDLFRDALRRGMSEVTYAEVRTSFEARIASGEFQRVPGQKHETGRQFTTAETIRAEKEILRQMQQGHGRAEQIMSIQAAVAHTEKQQHLNAGQRTAAEEILTSRDVVQGLEGRAGVGKTTLLRSVREAAEKRGYIVEGFAPTSRAANQLRDAGISADTLQGFLVRVRQPNPDRHLYMVDESSLASTKQVRDFLAKMESGDRVLLIGDTRQHYGVEAGKPFEQLVNAGMKTAQLDQIVRQREAPELLKAVEHLSRGEIAEGVALLEQQGRVTEIADPQQRIAAIARSYAANPDNTIVVSPDNASRRQINQAVRSELQALGTVASEDHAMRVLAPRSDMTGADRTWAARYAVDDVLYYSRGSQDIGIERQTYTKVIATQPKDNLLTVEKEDGATVTYNPARLYGVNVYRGLEREFAVGDRLGFTAPSKELGVANRDLGTVQQIEKGGQLTVKMDSGKSVSFDAQQMRHFDHGYAVTSHSSQGLTAERVMVNIDSNIHPDLINTRFAYVSVSRAALDAQIYTDDASTLIARLNHNVTKESALNMASQIANQIAVGRGL